MVGMRPLHVLAFSTSHFMFCFQKQITKNSPDKHSLPAHCKVKRDKNYFLCQCARCTVNKFMRNDSTCQLAHLSTHPHKKIRNWAACRRLKISTFASIVLYNDHYNEWLHLTLIFSHFLLTTPLDAAQCHFFPVSSLWAIIIIAMNLYSLLAFDRDTKGKLTVMWFASDTWGSHLRSSFVISANILCVCMCLVIICQI